MVMSAVGLEEITIMGKLFPENLIEGTVYITHTTYSLSWQPVLDLKNDNKKETQPNWKEPTRSRGLIDCG